MSLRKERTKWVMFLSSSQPQVEFRHVVDLVHGVLCLEKAGIDPQDIFIYIDSPNQNWDGVFGSASTHQFKSQSSSFFFEELKTNDYENLVMFVTGHGGPAGIDAPTPITPSQLLLALKGTPKLKSAIVYLGQCFAGTFNFVSAGKVKDNDLDPDVILVGATNLHASLSSGTTETFLGDEIFPWSANVFLLHVFKWMSSPTDVDGDGLYTVMDSYKHAGMYTNMINKNIKNQGFSRLIDTHTECNALQALVSSPTGDDQIDSDNKLNLDGMRSLYENLLAIHHTHQECWILNSRPAQKIEF